MVYIIWSIVFVYNINVLYMVYHIRYINNIWNILKYDALLGDLLIGYYIYIYTIILGKL